MKHLVTAAVGAAALLGVSVSTASAATVEIQAYDAGWYRNNGTDASHDPGNTNIAAGEATGYRNFFTFDLSSVSGIVTSATLVISANGNPANTNPNVTYSVYDYTGDISTLLNGTGGLATWTDLGSGVLYGTTNVVAANTPMPDVSVILAGALVDINGSLGGLFALGGTSNATGFLWGSSEGVANTKLVLDVAPVPIPAALPLLLSALGGLGFFGWRRRKAVAA